MALFDIRHPVVVNCPAYDEENGGGIVLHYLVDRLRAIGVEAYAYPMTKTADNGPMRGLRTLVRRRRQMRRFCTNSAMDVPLAPAAILERSIAVYPEIISGNPLGAPHVVRWLLHKRGHLRPSTTFTPNELTFYFNKAFIEGDDTVDRDNQLRLRWIRDDLYFDQGRRDRRGSCRMIRKAAKFGAPDIPAGDDAIRIDGLSHAEIADIFNRTDVFYCHDPYTMYLYYAARCGCLPIVVPTAGISVEQWRPDEEERWGMAYGVENADWARRTRPLMMERVQRERDTENAMVERFARKLAAAFN